MTGAPPRRSAVFDFDGTLADSLEQVVIVYNEVARDLGIPAVSPDDLARLRGMTPLEAVAAMRVPAWKLPLLATRVRRGLRDRLHLVHPFPGLDAGLRRLREAGVRCFVLSTNSTENIRAFLAREGMYHFDAVAGGASVFGKARHIAKLVERERLDPRAVLYVGDEVRDVDAARGAGVRAVSVSWGYAAREALAAQGPDLIVDHPDALADALLSLG